METNVIQSMVTDDKIDDPFFEGRIALDISKPFGSDMIDSNGEFVFSFFFRQTFGHIWGCSFLMKWLKLPCWVVEPILRLVELQDSRVRSEIPAGRFFHASSVYFWVFMWNVPQNVPSNKNKGNIVVFRDGVVGNISACHADARGSIPRRGASFFRLGALFVMGIQKNLRNIPKCKRMIRSS